MATIIEHPVWLDKQEYPFEHRHIIVQGNTLHYIDEGIGDVLLFVHGTPVWSYLYRHCVKKLSKHYRCIALDHLGFGLSDKPQNADYSPKAHAERLGEFVKKLGLQHITLITQDYGGPISLDFASSNPEIIQRIVIANSWIWLHPRLEQGGKLFSSVLGKWLYLQYGFSAKVMIRQAYGNKKLLTKEIHNHYLNPLNVPEKRLSTYALVTAFAKDHQWYAALQECIHSLADKPVLMLWGKKDRFVRYEDMMPLWKELWKNLRIVEFPEAGHFVEEELPQECINSIEEFISQTS